MGGGRNATWELLIGSALRGLELPVLRNRSMKSAMSWPAIFALPSSLSWGSANLTAGAQPGSGEDTEDAWRAVAEAAVEVTRLGLTLNDTKTKLKDARTESFDFLGYVFGPHRYWKNGRRYLGASPSQKGVARNAQKAERPPNPEQNGPVA